MSFYSMLFGMNSQSDLILAVLGLRRHDVERFRDVYVSGDGKTIDVYSRTGGGNRSDYPNILMRKLPSWQKSYDDDFDCTYCTDEFQTPNKFVDDVRKLDDILTNGLRPEFGQHLAKTLRREPTEADKEHIAYEKERNELKRTSHFMANGHTFVPRDDWAMKKSLELAEQNSGKLRSCWGALPLRLEIKQNHQPYPNAKTHSEFIHRVKTEVKFQWEIDIDYWQHCKELFEKDFPLAMTKIEERVNMYLERARKN